MIMERAGAAPTHAISARSVAGIPEAPTLLIVFAGTPPDVVAIVDLRRTEIVRARAALLALAASAGAEAPLRFARLKTVRGIDRELLRLRRAQGHDEPALQREMLRRLGRPVREGSYAGTPPRGRRARRSVPAIEFEAQMLPSRRGGKPPAH